ncbi:MAG: hypothetical protein HY319_27750 [Armatimonadetes bacterium]|nr:hypothetical protein [Armatimonadota bacterium]
MAYRPCRFRSSHLGVFQCDKHAFLHSHPEIYNELYEFCLEHVPDRFCDYVDFGFTLEGEVPRLFANCTHPYQSRPLRSFRDCLEECDYHLKECESLG